MYERDNKEYLKRLTKTARSCWMIGVSLVILMLTLLHFTSQNKQVTPKVFSDKLDNRILVKQNRFKDRIENINKVCAEENKRKRYKYDLNSHISQ